MSFGVETSIIIINNESEKGIDVILSPEKNMSMPNKIDLKPLETKDLILRPFKMSDLNDFYEYARQPEVGPKAGWKPHTSKAFTARILQSFIKTNDVYAIVLKRQNIVIGSIGIHYRPLPAIISAANPSQNYREIGYVLNSDYWGNGYMPQAVAAVIYYAIRHLKLDFLAVSHNKENHASRRVIEKCGFKYLGEYEKEMVFLDGQMVTSRAYILELDKDWKPQSNYPYDGVTIFS